MANCMGLFCKQKLQYTKMILFPVDGQLYGFIL